MPQFPQRTVRLKVPGNEREMWQKSKSGIFSEQLNNSVPWIFFRIYYSSFLLFFCICKNVCACVKINTKLHSSPLCFFLSSSGEEAALERVSLLLPPLISPCCPVPVSPPCSPQALDRTSTLWASISVYFIVTYPEAGTIFCCHFKFVIIYFNLIIILFNTLSLCIFTSLIFFSYILHFSVVFFFCFVCVGWPWPVGVCGLWHTCFGQMPFPPEYLAPPAERLKKERKTKAPKNKKEPSGKVREEKQKTWMLAASPLEKHRTFYYTCPAVIINGWIYYILIHKNS